ncbi:unnamed protein product [Lota lota]
MALAVMAPAVKAPAVMAPAVMAPAVMALAVKALAVMAEQDLVLAQTSEDPSRGSAGVLNTDVHMMYTPQHVTSCHVTSQPVEGGLYC